MMSITTINAQDIVRNSINCAFFVRAAYGPARSCTSTGFADAICPANTQINIGIPPGTKIIASKGGYALGHSGVSCPYYVGLPCTPYSLTTNVGCSVLCGDYNVRLYPGLGIRVWN